jgi:putative ABC transport system permease protein
MIFVQILVTNLLRRKTRTILTVLGLAVSVAATAALLSTAWTYAESAVGSYESRGVDIVVVRAGVADRLTSSFNSRLAARLSTLPEIASVNGALTEMVSLGKHSMMGVPLEGLDAKGLTARQIAISSGRTLRTGDHRVVLLGAGIARALAKNPGDVVEIEGNRFVISGIFQSPNALELNSAIAPLDDVQRLMDREGQVSEFQVRLSRPTTDAADVRRVCQRIETLADERGQLLGFKALAVRKFVDMGTERRLMAAMAWGTSALTVLLSLVGMLNTMLMSVLERTKELGILKAIGWSRRRVLRMVLGESLLLGGSSLLAGGAGAWLLVRIFANWSFTNGVVQPRLSLSACALTGAITLSAGLLGSFYPAYRAATVPSTEALRFE